MSRSFIHTSASPNSLACTRFAAQLNNKQQQSSCQLCAALLALLSVLCVLGAWVADMAVHAYMQRMELHEA